MSSISRQVGLGPKALTYRTVSPAQIPRISIRAPTTTIKPNPIMVNMALLPLQIALPIVPTPLVRMIAPSKGNLGVGRKPIVSLKGNKSLRATLKLHSSKRETTVTKDFGSRDYMGIKRFHH
jgi:hypothetical protein